jgi:RNA polymerase sigma-70 factor (ECF subfamily)
MAVASVPMRPRSTASLLLFIPHLRAFGRALSHDPVLGDDLAQDTLAKALASRGSYTPGANIKGGSIGPFATSSTRSSDGLGARGR